MNPMISVALIIGFGTMAQWIAWRFRLPSILLLLLAGFLAGPVFRLISPDQLFGSLLFPFVSYSVAIILFEGGMDLRWRELTSAGTSVRNLVSIGVLITWVLGAIAAYFYLDLPWRLAWLLAAILVVTGPTVIGPLLRQIRLTGSAASILKWEGIVIDPIGAILAVLVFEAILAGGVKTALTHTIIGLVQAGLVGIIFGLIGAGIMLFALRKYLIPDFLQSPFSLMLVMVIFAAANRLQPESGLLATTTMGIVLANQQTVSIKRIVEFKETLRVLLISILFVVLAARLRIEDFSQMHMGIVWFLLFLIVVVRPVATLASTWGAQLKWKEKLLIAWMAPRGIVAAAIGSVFAIDLIARGVEGAEQIVPIVFTVIVGTVLFYALTAPWVARLLRLSNANPQGVVFLGGHKWARELALILQKNKFRAVIYDTNTSNVSAARLMGIEAYEQNILSASLDDLNLEGVGRMIALTPNDDVNALAAIRFSGLMGTAEVYQLPFKEKKRVDSEKKRETGAFRGCFLFDEESTYTAITNLVHLGAVVKSTELTKEFTYADYQQHYGKQHLPLFLIVPGKELHVFTTDIALTPKAGQTLISLVFKPDETQQHTL